jgi:hypothetical protein
MKTVYKVIGRVVALRHDERGLSQSTETAIYVGVAAVVALSIGAFVTAYVNQHLPQP